MFMLSVISCTGLRTKDPAQSEFDIGLSLFNVGKYEESIPHFQHATELNPEFGKAYLYLGRTYLDLGRWHEAIIPMRTALRLSPEETKKEIADIFMDFLLQNVTRLDLDSQRQIMEFLKKQ
jgi:tetratricopeptide (TPR) repeat protein